MLTFDAELRDSLRRGTSRIRFGLDFTVGGQQYILHDGSPVINDSSLAPALTSASLSMVSPVTREFNPLDSAIASPKASVVLVLDERVKMLVRDYRLAGVSAGVYFGTDQVTPSNWQLYLAGVISAVRPNVASREVTIEIRGGLHQLFRANVSGYWSNHHPLEVMLDVIDRAGIPSSLYTASEFAPSTAAYADMGHLVVNNCLVGVVDQAAAPDTGAESRKASDIISELCELADLQLVEGENGKIRVIFFDPTASVARTWTDGEDCWDIQQIDTVGPIINRVDVTRKSMDSSNGITITREDTDSQTDWGEIFSRSIDFKGWLVGSGCLELDSSPATDPAMTAVAGAGTRYRYNAGNPMSGMRWSGVYPAGSQPTEAEITADRLLYLMIDEEVIAFDELLFGAYSDDVVAHFESQAVDPHTGAPQSFVAPALATVKIAARAQLSTTAAGHLQHAPMYDVTPCVWIADRRVSRFRNGAPIIKARTRFDQAEIQLGDLLGIVTDRYLGFGADGLDATTKWQVVGKSPQPFAADPHIEWTLMRAVDPGEPAGTFASRSWSSWRTRGRARGEGIIKAEAGELRASSGFGVKSSSGLSVTLDRGAVATLFNRFGDSADPELTLQATRDHYITRSLVTPSYIVYSVPVSDPEPLAPGAAFLQKVTTDGSGVTGTVDKRTDRALTGALLVSETIDSDKLGPLSVITSKLGESAVTAYKMDGDARAQNGVFQENFDQVPSAWTNNAGTGTESIVANGETGGNALKVEGYRWRIYDRNIPFDPSKLYRMRVRVRRRATTDAAKQLVYFGIVGIAADGSTLVNTTGAASYNSQHYFVASGVDGAGWTVDEWQTFTGWFGGRASSGAGGQSNDQKSPGLVYSTVRYIRPMMILNYNGGPVGNVLEVDYISLDIFDELAESRGLAGTKQAGLVTNRFFALATKK